MPLLLCPNDNAGMNTVSRNGVEFDICPQCRGVWLDRGELEKLMEAATASAAQYAQPAPAPTPPPQSAPWGQPQPQHHQPQHHQPYPPQHQHHSGPYGHQGGYYKKKKKLDIFDIFD